MNTFVCDGVLPAYQINYPLHYLIPVLLFHIH